MCAAECEPPLIPTQRSIAQISTTSVARDASQYQPSIDGPDEYWMSFCC